ncbi:pilus assembly protein TadG-related protein [Roseitranquillus sediminis]|uniref:pilus assembly protein TadG-related protein n=1 Tax=Roseitranquillus sediminis TaxID=2809051 RepID=UPI001D0CABD7|nr:pilus assembly protein TadG-related protein [Roseitranquillus sediminis]
MVARAIFKFRRTLHRFTGDTNGAIAVMAAIAFPVLVGGMALGAEAGYWYLSHRKLQQASDLAAYAAAVQLRSGRGNAEMVAAAGKIAEASDFRTGDDTLALAHPPATGSRAGSAKAVEVVVKRQQTRFFTLIYTTEPVEISARAVAEVRGGGNACLLTLDPTVGGAITVGGSSEVIFDGCDVATNSNAYDAFLMQGGKVELTAGCVHSVGGVSATSGLNLTACTSPHTQSPAIRDPYADLAEPMNIGTCSDSSVGSNNKTITVTPHETHPLGMPLRRYCGGLELKGDVTFSPGLYIVDGGTFRINASAYVTGSGVTFFLTNGAEMAFNGSATLDLSAPTSGPFSGILFYSDRDDVGLSHSINGNAGSTLNGAVYLSSSDLSYSGNFSGTYGCTQIVTRRVTFTGNSSLNVDCSAAGTRRIPVGEIIALVE